MSDVQTFTFEKVNEEPHYGRFSTIYKVKPVNCDYFVAVKELNENENKVIQSNNNKYFLRDIESHLKTMDHPNIVHVYGWLTSSPDQSSPTALCMEYMEHTLDFVISNSRPSEEKVRNWLRQIASALAYMHSKKFIHRDIQPLSVFTNDYNLFKIGKMELSRMTSNKMTANVGEPGYQAPEVRSESGEEVVYTDKCDSYSLFVTGLKAFNKKKAVDEEFVEKALISLRTNENVSDGLKEMFYRNLSETAENRDSMDEIGKQLEALDTQSEEEMRDA